MKKAPCCTHKKTNKDLTHTIEFLKIISQEQRLKILCLLKNGEHCVCDIWQHLDMPQNLVSHHLKVLKDYGLITSRKDGTKVLYTIHEKAVTQHTHLLNHFLIPYGN
ncbi:MAG: Arsenical resistance operon repressor [Candidatus Magasanikbacteria bacterium GW2011_GWD2_43_18]|nr:MAG: Arsenical resistance operon repressor [Candidatus Magasanikbacteria bacterium GW2011_GWC2_42_27]KKT04588.1 MAG: Arsenical resistance operon repressor [Candidatus Magasanikbacteria bacterium GW2011_GWD2_43_18]KKT24452.1 MAG: Arsenical resistance operon repressor [Candidatus Magasanikbacteria bacterium GW2011_GWA2_43_9]HBB38158.1 transcriptional regulator [Candidatus Magasanikbacteria bacterium]HCC13712.1 transcriptional regulator [Candidatus Magasanikbacteria bacterium]